MPSNPPSHIDRYEVMNRLSHGGMGDVYLARDPKLGGRRVAIKTLRIADDTMRARALREAAIAGNLIHPNIVTIYDSGEHEGQPFIVMEFVEGSTLGGLIRSRPAMPLARKLQLVVDLADGLEYAHTFRAGGIAGIVHRDIKPDNLIVDRNDVLRILDFGIAVMTDSRMTLDRSAIGTPSYMSPEQVAGGVIDHRSDIFSAGLVFYELLSYQKAFPGDNFHTVMNAVVNDMPRPLREVAPDVDPVLDEIILHAIQKEPGRRHQSMAAFAADVRQVAGLVANEPIVVRRGGSGDTPRPNPPAGRGPVQTPRPGGTRAEVQREALSKRRLEAIEAHLRTARAAFDAGDFAAAVSSSEAAALLDPDEPRVLELLDQVRAATDTGRVEEWLPEARAHAERREYTKALELLHQVLEVDPGSPDAQRLKLDVEEAQAREDSVRSAMAKAQALFAEGRFESAIRAASEVLVHDPVHQAAHELSRAALRSLDEQRRRDALARAARLAVDEQRRAFTAGRCREAVAALERYAPPHELVATALEGMRADLAKLETWAAGELARARDALATGKWAEATSLLEQVNARLPGTQGVAEVFKAARDGEAADEARRRQATADAVRAAREAMAKGLLDLAVGQVTIARGLAPGDSAVSALDAELQRALTARKRQQELDSAAAVLIENARNLFGSGEHAAAISTLERVAPPHPAVSRALAELRAEVSALEAAARAQADERRREDSIRTALNRARQLFSSAQFAQALRAADEVLAIDPRQAEARELARDAASALDDERLREQHDRAARELVDEQVHAFDAGHRREAVAALEQFDPPHQLVVDTLDDLRHQLEVLEDWAANQVIAARRAIAAGRFAEAARGLRQVADALPDTPELDTLLALATQGKAEAERRYREAVTEQLQEGRRALAAGRFDQATTVVSALLKAEPQNSDALALEAALRAAVAGKWQQEESDRAAAKRAADAARSAPEPISPKMPSAAPTPQPEVPASTAAAAAGQSAPPKKGSHRKASNTASAQPAPSQTSVPVSPAPPRNEAAGPQKVAATPRAAAPVAPAAAPLPKASAGPKLPTAYVAAGVAAVVALVAGGLWLTRRGSSEPTTTLSEVAVTSREPQPPVTAPPVTTPPVTTPPVTRPPVTTPPVTTPPVTTPPVTTPPV
ncbi:MAG: protein kinase, partial [Vicinamibacterales bacterium]